MPARLCRLRAALFGVLLPGALLLPALSIGLSAQQPTEASIASGMRIYRQKADCQACHGWAGDGRKMDNQMPDGANLRTSSLDREQLIFVIKCGLPGRDMPAFDRLAYTDERCLGRTRADLRRMGLTLPDPAATLQQREIERLADFLFAKVVGQGPWTAPPASTSGAPKSRSAPTCPAERRA